VKAVKGEQKRNALIRFFVAFQKQTGKDRMSKLSFVTNAISAHLNGKYDMGLFVEGSLMRKKTI